MNKGQFLKSLKKRLKKLKPSEVQKNLSYYDELISDMTENGMTEQEAIKEIGDPEALTKQILSEAAPESFRHADVIGRILIAASVTLVLLSALHVLLTRMLLHSIPPSASVGIIGGADGPTSIFIAGKIGWPVPYSAATAIVVITLLYFFWKHKRK